MPAGRAHLSSGRLSKGRSGKKTRANRSAHKSKAAGIAHPLQAWCNELGKDPKTLKKLLFRIGERPGPRDLIAFRTIQGAVFGDEHAEKIKGLRLDNAQRERDGKKEELRLIDVDLVRQLIARFFVQPAIAALDSCPPEAVEWRDKVMLPALRAQLEVQPTK